MSDLLLGLEEAATSAKALMPILSAWFEPRSVLDVGCRDGIFLHHARENGAERIAGFDRPSEEIRSALKIPAACYFGLDFVADEFPKVEPFDLAICLETVEHLPAAAGDKVVEFLCRSARNVVFSAAIPGQGGQNHVNEQWPSYWIARFSRHRWEADGTLRQALWTDRRIQPYYRQNLLVFSPDPARIGSFVQDAVHPEMWAYKLGVKR